MVDNSNTQKPKPHSKAEINIKKGSTVTTRGGIIAGNFVNAGSDSLEANINIEASVVDTESIISVNNAGIYLDTEFAKIFKSIDTRPEDPSVDKKEIYANVSDIKSEVSKISQPNHQKINDWLEKLAAMAYDIYEVTLAIVNNPLIGIGLVFQKISKKATEQKQ